MYNLVIVKQESGKYLFMVSDEHKNDIKAGDTLMLSTVRGEKIGTAICDSFTCDNETAEYIMQTFSTKVANMKYVIGKAKYERWENNDREG